MNQTPSSQWPPVVELVRLAGSHDPPKIAERGENDLSGYEVQEYVPQHQGEWPEEAVEVLARRLYALLAKRLSDLTHGSVLDWQKIDEAAQRDWRDHARNHLSALSPFLGQGRVEPLSEALEDIEAHEIWYEDAGDETFEQIKERVRARAREGLEAAPPPHPAPLSEQDREKLKRFFPYLDSREEVEADELAAFLRDLAEQGGS